MGKFISICEAAIEFGLAKVPYEKKDRLRNIAFQAAHAIINTAKEIRAEDLTMPIVAKEKYNRKISEWAKGSLACDHPTMTLVKID